MTEPMIREVYQYEEFRDIDYSINGDAEFINLIRVSGIDEDDEYLEERRNLTEQLSFDADSISMQSWYGVEWTEWRGRTTTFNIQLRLPL